MESGVPRTEYPVLKAAGELPRPRGRLTGPVNPLALGLRASWGGFFDDNADRPRGRLKRNGRLVAPQNGGISHIRALLHRHGIGMRCLLRVCSSANRTSLLVAGLPE
jgi:hypothetical protein